MLRDSRQFVRFLLLKLDPSWRHLTAAEQIAHKQELGTAIRQFHARLLLRSYSLVGTRGDAELMFWLVADEMETFQAFQTVLFSTRLGTYCSIAYSYLGMNRRSIYQFRDLPEAERHIELKPQDSRFLFLYPFVKTREWYALPLPRRQQMMDEHVAIGRRHPGVRLNTVYSFGLDDQEFVLAFETDDPGDFLTLVMELRESEASRYTLRDTPIFTCIQMSIWDALDALGAASGPAAHVAPTATRQDGLTEVAAVEELSDGMGKRIYLGTDAIALFKVGGTLYAVSDRCTHGRASLSDGRVEPGSCILECPWHGGRFDLSTGQPVAGPPQAPLRTYRVEVEKGRILVG
jgi:chlorite dismutase/nitrite reductase/ring-hydroxylating ferredoxin subunit